MRYKIALLLLLLIPQVCWAVVNLNGDADYINNGDSFYSNSLTLSIWAKNDGLEYESLISKRNSSGVTAGTLEWDFGQGGDVNGTVYFSAWDSSSVDVIGMSTTTGVVVNGWNHIVARCDGTDADLFVNGVNTDGAQSGTIRDSTSLIQIGVRTSNNSTRFWDGDITEVYIWNVALTDAEVANLYGGGAPIKGIGKQFQPTGLMIYYPTGERGIETGINGDVVKDYSGNYDDGAGVDADGDSFWTSETFMSYPDEFAQ